VRTCRPFAELTRDQRRAAADAEPDVTDAVAAEAWEEGWSRDDLVGVVNRHARAACVVLYPTMRRRIIEAAARPTRMDWRREE